MTYPLTTEFAPPPLRFQPFITRLHEGDGQIPSPRDFSLPTFDGNLNFLLRNWQFNHAQTLGRYGITLNTTRPDAWAENQAVSANDISDPLFSLAYAFSPCENSIELFHHPSILDLAGYPNYTPFLTDVTLHTYFGDNQVVKSSSPSLVYTRNPSSTLVESGQNILRSYADAVNGFPGPLIESNPQCYEHLNQDHHGQLAESIAKNKYAIDLIRLIADISAQGGKELTVSDFKHLDYSRDYNATYYTLKSFLAPVGREHKVTLAGQVIFGGHNQNWRIWEIERLVKEQINIYNIENLHILQSVVGGYLEILKGFLHPKYHNIADYVMSTWVYGASLLAPMQNKNLDMIQTDQ